MGPDSSAWTSSGALPRASSGMAMARSGSTTCSNSGTPDSVRKHLNANAPARAIAATSPALPGTTPPANATSTHTRPSAAAAFVSSAASDVVAGMLLSGMSISVVTPPAAAARVAVSNPSHSERPGSSMWTCVSTSPGSTARSPTSSRIASGTTAS